MYVLLLIIYDVLEYKIMQFIFRYLYQILMRLYFLLFLELEMGTFVDSCIQSLSLREIMVNIIIDLMLLLEVMRILILGLLCIYMIVMEGILDLCQGFNEVIMQEQGVMDGIVILCFINAQWMMEDMYVYEYYYSILECIYGLYYYIL